MIDITNRDVLIDAKVYLTTHISIDKSPTQTIEELKQHLRHKHGPAALIGTTEQVRSFWTNICSEMMFELADTLKKHCLALPEFRPSRLTDALDLEISLSTRQSYGTTQKAG